jgi:hypothetical protein
MMSYLLTRYALHVACSFFPHFIFFQVFKSYSKAEKAKASDLKYGEVSHPSFLILIVFQGSLQF